MDTDVCIIGSGVGGSAVAWSLAPAGARVLVLERGGHLPREPENSDPEAVFGQLRYRTTDTWLDGAGKPFRPGQYYFVGGHTKFFGTAMFRFRKEDFGEVVHEEGVSPTWPITYDELAPWYDLAEDLFQVHGKDGVDPCEPPRAHAFPYGPVPHEPVLARLEERMRQQGLQPFAMPASIGLHDGGGCVRCSSCDAHPCRIDAKGDAETRLLRPAMRTPNVTLWTGSEVVKLETSDDGKRVVAAVVRREGREVRVTASLFVLSAGAINSAALLLRSASARYPDGLANGSGQVGRNYMNHNCTALMALDPRQVNATRFPKTLALNDFYFGDGAGGPPLGNLQMLGKLQPAMLRAALPWAPAGVLAWLARHSVDMYAMSEDLPHPDSRVRVTPSGQIQLDWRRTNLAPHRRLVQRAKRMLRRAGYPVVLSRPFGMDTPSHQCGTLRFGSDPASSVLDPWCRTWQLDNLYVVDASFFPSSAALNPALTIAAQALRVGAHLRTHLNSFLKVEYEHHER
ncbi:MAG: GMC family oxidoreductase [Pseudomonadota bacterium]